jgi:hypothetical protein
MSYWEAILMSFILHFRNKKPNIQISYQSNLYSLWVKNDIIGLIGVGISLTSIFKYFIILSQKKVSLYFILLNIIEFAS